MECCVAVIGGGAAGIMAAVAAAGQGASVVILEKNDKIGKKLSITGNGRCNITHNTDVDGILDKTVANPYFLYSALYGLPPHNLIEFFNKLGLPTKTEADGRVFPVSDKSSDVIDIFMRHLESCSVQIRFNSNVSSITKDNCDGRFQIKLQNGQVFSSNKCIIATGGLSYPTTGSTGDGLMFAKKLGHKIANAHPSLTPLVCSEKWVEELMGLSLKNVLLTAYIGKSKVFGGVGELIFTHYGISGPLVLSASAYLVGKSNAKISIDLKPDEDKVALDAKILQIFNESPNKGIKNTLDGLLPKKLAPIIIKLAGIDPDKKVNSVTKEERVRLINQIKSLELNITGNRGLKEAVITAGGVCVSQIDSSTMESKIVPNLYFAGEVIDVHALTGGYNLQIAFATGHLAGMSASQQ